jgi:hypothetical protein
LSEKSAKNGVLEGPMGDFGGSDYCASCRGPERDSLAETIITISEFGYLKVFMKRRAKVV